MTIGYLTPYTKIYPIETHNYQVTGRDTIKVRGREVKVFEYSDSTFTVRLILEFIEETILPCNVLW